MELFTLGVEEEFGLVDPATGRLVPKIVQTLASLSEAERVEIKPDVHQATLEIATPVCLDLDEVRAELRRLRHLARRAANRAGVELLPVGAHPNCRWREQPVVDYPRYHRLAEYQGEKWLRCLFWGLHVHLGVPEEQERVTIANGLRPYLPLFIACAANSPFWEGKRHPAADARLDSVAFPAISTGAYGYPLDAACGIAVRTVAEVLAKQEHPGRVIFCGFGARATRALSEALAALHASR